MTKLTDRIDENEISRACAQLKASILMSLESTSSRCEQMARQMSIYGRPITVEETVEKIDSVNEAGLKKVAGRFLTSEITLSAVGPCSKISDRPLFT